MNMQRMKVILRRTAIGAGVSIVAGWPFAQAIATAPPTVAVSQVPMTVEIPAHPQILLAVGNSQSMDGTLSGAIYRLGLTQRQLLGAQRVELTRKLYDPHWIHAAVESGGRWCRSVHREHQRCPL